MIFVYWQIFIVLDAQWNHWKIKRDIHIFHGLEGVYRTVAGIAFVLIGHVATIREIFSLHFDHWHILALMSFAIGGFFQFWLTFNIILNKMDGFKGLEVFTHLSDKSILDRLEGKMPSIVARYFFKVLFASGFIYGFYNLTEY